ncbi:hypothetical protein Q8791_29265 [Nocardiopsis sp. CT-R113]|uniref:Uncharacterized protein n=1 Tax=Nocardiopsis codii TaxID=3065942 RepID=A0ABU7KIB4_9ACTN|nr:hypothetical protein [Nocardiopsis sp. CT-R113]MEE2041322.1 hypothetical protein [Nocardiopsis sp. CT-R113]
MRLRLVAIDPGTDGDHCPAVFTDEGSGDLILQGWTVTDPETILAAREHEPLKATESLVLLPARLNHAVLRWVDADGRHSGKEHPKVGTEVGFVHGSTGDLVFRGLTVVDPDDLSQVREHSPTADNELVIRIGFHEAGRIREVIAGDTDSPFS